jgi:hypothetical protein
VTSNPLTQPGIVFLGKLIVAYLVRKFKASYGTPIFITSFTIAPWRIALFEKLIVAYLVKKLKAFYGTRKFITSFTTDRHWSLP